jgi:hypothetical protein
MKTQVHILDTLIARLRKNRNQMARNLEQGLGVRNQGSVVNNREGHIIFVKHRLLTITILPLKIVI